MSLYLQPVTIARAFTLFALAITSQVTSSEPASLTAQPVQTDSDIILGNASHAWLVSHNNFEIKTQHRSASKLPIFGVFSKGMHTSLEARTADILEKMDTAWSILEQGGKICVSEDNRAARFANNASVNKAFKQCGPSSNKACPSIFVLDFNTNRRHRIMTVMPDDINGFAVSNRTQITGDPEMYLATYLASLTQAHHLLFQRMSPDVTDYELLALGRVAQQGQIFRTILLETQSIAAAQGSKLFKRHHLVQALQSMSNDDAYQISKLSDIIPADWSIPTTGDLDCI